VLHPHSHSNVPGMNKAVLLVSGASWALCVSSLALILICVRNAPALVAIACAFAARPFPRVRLLHAPSSVCVCCTPLRSCARVPLVVQTLIPAWCGHCSRVQPGGGLGE
jgi:hypothetical protein